ncbi:MAG: hypothetical protein HF314_01505 [Ignavibacteria bacterium]|nr:hypothetical protein [Ignavibacteria bacterium]MCU7501718.1 hypothetical protein [Ignavibacteria bacterium]MCU7516875.1 hypothetical protein [Ignavibacteria bacterium]
MLLLGLKGCVNPFAPALDENLNSGTSLIMDQSKVEGVFQNMQYAYTMKDTTIYGQLLSPDFTFTYRDYDKGFDVTWGRDDEMRATYGLFQNSQRLDLIWNNILLISGDSTSIVRSFNLTITFNPTDIQRADGKVSLILKKNTSTKAWQIQRWVDESSF